jgi:hypothetical protein
MVENLTDKDGLDQVTSLIEYYQRMKKYYLRDDQMMGNKRGESDAQYRALCQVLMSTSLDEIGFSTNTGNLDLLSQKVVNHFVKEAPDALREWVRRQKDLVEKLLNRGDERIKRIFKLAQKTLESDINCDRIK